MQIYPKNVNFQNVILNKLKVAFDSLSTSSNYNHIELFITVLNELDFSPEVSDLNKQISSYKDEIRAKACIIDDQSNNIMSLIKEKTELITNNEVNERLIRAKYQKQIESMNIQLSQEKKKKEDVINEQAKQLLEQTKRIHGDLYAEITAMQTVTEQHIFI